MIASTTVPVDASGAETVMGLIEALEDLDDVQNVYSNVDIPDEVLAALAGD
jgi:transcriptional/translational regulatory protein YebC/TACO1